MAQGSDLCGAAEGTAEQLCDPLWCVRDSASFITSAATHVKVDQAAVQAVALHWKQSGLLNNRPPFDRKLHFVDETDVALTVQYLFFVDALNFCFWPDEEGETDPFEYHHLAGGLKAALEADRHALDCSRLVKLDGPGLRALLRWPRPLPLEQERARVLRQTAGGLRRHFGGKAMQLVETARGSASTLVELLLGACPAFRDTAVYRGRQVSFLKRAQIFVGDLYGAFDGKGAGAFKDIDKLTMFADYRVPVVLRQLGILRYSPQLAAAVDARQELLPASEEEQEIRALSIMAVEALRTALLALGEQEDKVNSVLLDWCLWEIGEASIALSPPHHRTRTCFY